MKDLAIRVEGLSKSFRLGHRLSYHRFSEFLENIAKNIAYLPKRLFSPGAKTPLQEMDTFWALKDVSFEVKQGEVLGFIGRNGAGKSTLLKLLSRITRPTQGRIELHGRVGSLLEVGTGFHPELTGRENIYLNGAVLGMTRQEIRKKFDEIVAFSEVEKFLDTAVKYYSSGMYVRLAFAVAAHLEPEILIVDEVLAVGDAAFQQKCMGKMGAASRQGKTVLIVSHSVPDQQLYTALWLKDSNGTFVLATSNVRAISSTDDPWYGTPQPTGLYESTCVIPGNFLNEGRYVVSAIVGRVPQKTTILEESVLTFDVHDTGAMREEYFGNWTGPVIRPRLPWNTIQQTLG